MRSGRQPVPELVDCQRGVAHQWRRRLRRRRAHRPLDQEGVAKRVKATVVQFGEGLYRLLRCAALTWGSRLRASSTSAGERPSMIR